ncbi:MAG: hypothetical protein LBM02_09165 [Lachnospiraceae bacterium]|jgi:hypothetical protein|nr:hypothetical protein [Lachnospiraceae bacterium]
MKKVITTLIGIFCILSFSFSASAAKAGVNLEYKNSFQNEKNSVVKTANGDNEKPEALGIDQFIRPSSHEDYNFTNGLKAKHMSVSPEEKFGYTITSYYPMEIGATTDETYVITDKINPFVKCYEDTINVYSAVEKTSPVLESYLLSSGKDYQVAFNSEDNSLSVSLTHEGMVLLGNRYINNGESFVIVKFDCSLRENATQGIGLYSHASVVYQGHDMTSHAETDPAILSSRNSKMNNNISQLEFSSLSNNNQILRNNKENQIELVDDETSTPIRKYEASVPDEPEIHTGQIVVFKYDANNKTKALSGASFGLATSKENANAGKFIKTGQTDGNGKIVFKNLHYGNVGDAFNEDTAGSFWLVETKAPSGYVVLDKPVEVKFKYQRANDGEYFIGKINVYNQHKSSSPFVKTGDRVRLIFAIVLLVASLTLIFGALKRRKSK